MSVVVSVVSAKSVGQNTGLQAYSLMLMLWYIPNLNYKKNFKIMKITLL
jgi:hypothetical protein